MAGWCAGCWCVLPTPPLLTIIFGITSPRCGTVEMPPIHQYQVWNRRCQSPRHLYMYRWLPWADVVTARQHSPPEWLDGNVASCYGTTLCWTVVPNSPWQWSHKSLRRRYRETHRVHRGALKHRKLSLCRADRTGALVFFSGTKV